MNTSLAIEASCSCGGTLKVEGSNSNEAYVTGRYQDFLRAHKDCKVSTSHAGSASPSTAAARPEASGPAGECCSHPIGDHTRRGWCTWTGCTCKIPPIATITDEASAISEDEWRWEGNVTRPAKMCWHCNKSPREENQILCKACVEHSTNEMVQAGVDFRRAAHDPRWLTGVPLPE